MIEPAAPLAEDGEILCAECGLEPVPGVRVLCRGCADKIDLAIDEEKLKR